MLSASLNKIFPSFLHITQVRLRDLQLALSQRDAIIQQLTLRLRATVENSLPDCYAETQNLAKQVALLQRQLTEVNTNNNFYRFNFKMYNVDASENFFLQWLWGLFVLLKVTELSM